MIRFRPLIIVFISFLILTGCRQEEKLFYPEKLPSNYIFNFNHPFEELYFQVDEHTKLNGLLFHTPSSKGLVFYLHGNAGSIASWGDIAGVYLQNHYDFFIPDYRGYGKSEGAITSEAQLYRDIQIVYDSIRKNYDESKVVIIGYSIGTGLAAQLASVRKPGLLILTAPYYNMTDLAQHYVSVIPGFAIRYKLNTNEYITRVKCPVVIFHGDQDEVIYTGSSLKLQRLFKKEDRLIILHGQTHNGINDNLEYRRELKKLMEK